MSQIISNKIRSFLRPGIFFVLTLFLFCLFSYTSCSVKAEQKSLTDKFVAIDSLISQNQIEAALKELKAARKLCYDKWTYLSLFKRYSKLNEMELAEKALKSALKIFPKDIDLIAVYTDFLLNNKRYDDAVKIGKDLFNSEYSGLYSEAVLRQDKNEDSEDLYNVYYNAYLSSKNPLWIKNCAILDLYNGNFENIIKMAPSAYKDAKDSYFWALAFYDSENYYKAIEALEKTEDFLSSYSPYVTSLLSDSYMAVSDMINAEKARQDLISNIDNIKDDSAASELLPKIMTNSAIWAYNQGNNENCADLLFYIVNQWPDYVPAIILYADFAWNSNLQREESPGQLALRQAGLATVEMEKYDKRRKIPLSDAKYRVDKALENTKDPYLNIVQLDLKYKLDKDLNERDKYRDLWNMLENNYDEEGNYKTLLIQYSLNYLLKSNNYDDAYNLFQSYILDCFEYNREEPFWTQIVENCSNIDKGILEFAAYFAASKNYVEEAIKLHEFIVYDNKAIIGGNNGGVGGIKTNFHRNKTGNKGNKSGKYENKSSANEIEDYSVSNMLISGDASTACCMNLGDIYYSIGKKDEALDLYGKIGGRESKKSIRSDIFYRIACIYSSIGDSDNALRSVEYACELYPENVKASLLKDKLK